METEDQDQTLAQDCDPENLDPSPFQDEYAPVILSQETVSHIVSIDMMSGKEDRENILRARASGKGVLTSPFKLLKSNHLGVVLTFAVYKTHLLPDATPEQRIKATVGRSLLVANAGDCRAVLSRHGLALEMSKEHRPCCNKERLLIESLGGFVEDGYLNGQLGVTRAIGNWHIKGLKQTDNHSGPLSAEPELKLVTLTKEDEFLIIGSDGIWDVFRNQNAVDFVRRRLQEHNDVKRCCKEMVEEAMKRGALDNLTVVVVCFQAEPPPPVAVQRGRVRRSISAEGLLNLKFHLEG